MWYDDTEIHALLPALLANCDGCCFLAYDGIIEAHVKELITPGTQAQNEKTARGRAPRLTVAKVILYDLVGGSVGHPSSSNPFTSLGLSPIDL
jgi:hypothetical protein